MDRRWLLLAVLVGVALVANPIWLVPAATEPRHVYRVSPATPTDVRADDRVLVCGVDDAPPACAVERRAVTEGVAVGRDPAAFSDRPAVVYLAAEDRYFRTGVRWVDGARTATGRPVSDESVREYVARDGPAEFPPPAAAVVADALDDGVARSRDRVPLDDTLDDGPVVVEHRGSYVAVRRTGVDRPAPAIDRYGRLLRGALSLSGVAIVALAGRAWRRR